VSIATNFNRILVKEYCDSEPSIVFLLIWDIPMLEGILPELRVFPL
jgi:hypothetical protein